MDRKSNNNSRNIIRAGFTILVDIKTLWTLKLDGLESCSLVFDSKNYDMIYINNGK